nr:hypothetical protein C5F59_06380 [Streptomyces sp. QL37]
MGVLAKALDEVQIVVDIGRGRSNGIPQRGNFDTNRFGACFDISLMGSILNEAEKRVRLLQHWQHIDVVGVTDSQRALEASSKHIPRHSIQTSCILESCQQYCHQAVSGKHECCWFGKDALLFNSGTEGLNGTNQASRVG